MNCSYKKKKTKKMIQIKYRDLKKNPFPLSQSHYRNLYSRNWPTDNRGWTLTELRCGEKFNFKMPYHRL